MLNVLDCDHSKEDLQEDTKQSATEKKEVLNFGVLKVSLKVNFRFTNVNSLGM